MSELSSGHVLHAAPATTLSAGGTFPFRGATPRLSADAQRVAAQPVAPAYSPIVVAGVVRLIEPILIAGTLDPSPPNRATFLALADGEWREEALGFERTFLLFDNSRIDDARATWRTLAARDDVDNRFWRQDERGRWSEGP